jgi:hypothetical protein
MLDRQSLEGNKQRIEGIFQHAKGTQINQCYAVFNVINSAPANQVSELLQHASELFGTIESDESEFTPPMISDSEKDELKGQYGEILDEILKSYIKRNMTEDEFYPKMWSAITSSVFDNEPSQVFALYYTLIDKRIPYFYVDMSQAVSMSNDEFSRIKRQIATQRAKVRFLLKREFPQKTQQASLILQELDGVVGEERVVLLASLINELNSSSSSGALGDVMRGLLGR